MVGRNRQHCAHCNKSLDDDDKKNMKFKGAMYHVSCVNCQSCGDQLKEDCYKEHAKEIVCTNCAQVRGDNRCTLCRTVKTKMIQRGKKFYCVDCYRCCHCNFTAPTYLQLFERLYCSGCETHFKIQRLAIVQFGSGPGSMHPL
ncbi:Rho GTPase activator [Aphelenchoides besseyi]|nr:Rho GTPase activator [Aphelenchoides besseyi]